MRRGDMRFCPLGETLARVSRRRAPPAAKLLSSENDRQSPDELGALPGGVSAEKGGEMEAGLPVGLKTLLFRFLKLTAAKASPPCLIPLAGGLKEREGQASHGIHGEFPSDSHLDGGDDPSQALQESTESSGVRPV